MKRIIGPALLVFCLLFLSAREQSPARQEAEKSKSPPQWKQIREGVQAATVWDTIGPTWPQTVLLRLQGNEYAAFLHEPERYVNDLKVLSKPTVKVKFCLEVKIRKDASKDIQYYIVVVHEPGSTSRVMVYEVSPTPPK